MHKEQNQSLSLHIYWAAQALKHVLAGRSLTEALSTVPHQEKAAAQSISFYCMRYLATAQALSQRLLDKQPPNSLVHSLLLVGLSLLTVPKQIFNEADTHRVPRYQAFTVVNETLKAAQRHKQSSGFKGLLNACLRRYLRQAEQLWQQIQQQETVKYGYPQWWIDIIRQTYPQQWQAILQAANTPGPLSLRVNKKKITRADFSAQLLAHDMAYQWYGDDAVILEKAVPVQDIPGFEKGMCAVQDAGAQLAASLLPLQEGMRVLDACAAPGGKTAHILETADVQLTAIDIDAKRLERVAQNLTQLGHNMSRVSLVRADVAQLSSWWDGKPFDIIMADVPCTASGVVRRHPDIKWLRQFSDIANTVALQRHIIESLWETLAWGGVFLYITCSVFPQEGMEQAQFIQAHLKGAQPIAAPLQLLPISNEGKPALHDGFFYALFRKDSVCA